MLDNNIIFDSIVIGKTTINLEQLDECNYMALSIKVSGDDEVDYCTFDQPSDARAAFQTIKDGANPWDIFGITDGIPEDWDLLS